MPITLPSTPTGNGTCSGCHTTCTEVTLTPVTVMSHAGQKVELHYMCTERCAPLYAAGPVAPLEKGFGYGTCDKCATVNAEVKAQAGEFRCRQCLEFMFDVTGVEYLTASIRTKNSTYVVVCRPRYGVRVICPSGEVLEATDLYMAGDLLLVRDNENDQTLLRTSPVLEVVVHVN